MVMVLIKENLTYDLTGGQFETEFKLFPSDAAVEAVRNILNDQHVRANVEDELVEILSQRLLFVEIVHLAVGDSDTGYKGKK